VNLNRIRTKFKMKAFFVNSVMVMMAWPILNQGFSSAQNAVEHCSGDGFEAIDTTKVVGGLNPVIGIHNRIFCTKGSEPVNRPEKVNWHITAVSDSEPLSVKCFPPGLIVPFITHDEEIIHFELGPNVGSIPEHQLKEAGVEVLIPESKFRVLEITSDGDKVFVNITSSSVEQFSVQMLGHGDSVWLITGGGTELTLDIPGTSNSAYIVADKVKVTSTGFTSNIYVVGTLESGSSIGGVSDYVLVQGDLGGSSIQLNGFQSTLVINNNLTDPCINVDDSGSENICLKTSQTVNISRFDVPCLSKTDVFQGCTSAAFRHSLPLSTFIFSATLGLTFVLILL